MWHSIRPRQWRAIAAVLVAVVLFGFPTASQAEATLRYNYGYSCNGERIVVGHCRRDSDMPGGAPTKPDDDYCQLYYPDRPKRGGFDAMGVELRGDLIRILEACGALGSTQPAANARQNAPPTSTQRPPLPAASPSASLRDPGVCWAIANQSPDQCPDGNRACFAMANEVALQCPEGDAICWAIASQDPNLCPEGNRACFAMANHVPLQCPDGDKVCWAIAIQHPNLCP